MFYKKFPKIYVEKFPEDRKVPQNDLSSVLVDERADVGDGVLEDAVRRRVRDHDARQLVRVHLHLRMTADFAV
jgi:hypothetical protein